MSKSFVRLVAGLAVVAMPMMVEAQAVCVGSPSCSLTPNVSLTIPKLVRLAMNTDSITLSTPNFATDSLNGQLVTTTYAGLNVRANAAWTLGVSTGAGAWTYASGGESGARTLAQLELESSCGSTTWAAISGSAQQVASGARTNSAAASICLRTVFPADYADVANRPGVYQLPITILLTAP